MRPRGAEAMQAYVARQRCQTELLLMTVAPPNAMTAAAVGTCGSLSRSARTPRTMPTAPTRNRAERPPSPT